MTKDLAVAFGIHQKNKRNNLIYGEKKEPVANLGGMELEDAKSLVEAILAKKAPKDEPIEESPETDLLLSDEDTDSHDTTPVVDDRKKRLSSILAQLQSSSG